jgi:AraC family transcriptional regulator
MPSSTRADYDARIAQAQRYLNEHLDGEVNLEALAETAGIPPFYFHRVFRGMTGERVSECVQRLRMQSVALQLRQAGQPGRRTMMSVGYASIEEFAAAFQEQFGCDPAEWREGMAARPQSRYKPPEGLEARVTHRPAMHMAYIRQAPEEADDEDSGRDFSPLLQWARSRGLLSGPYYTVGVAYDDPDVTPAAQLRSDTALIVSRPAAGSGEVRMVVLPERDYAVVRHVGPYEKLNATYVWLCGVWLPESGREAAAAPPLEFYRNHPRNTAPEELVTDIHLPLEG